MNIALIGYGKMGKTIEKIALSKGHQIIAKIDVGDFGKIPNLARQDVVAIEFTQPDAAFDNIKMCVENSIPVVSGTTGWLDRKPEIEQLCAAKESAFFYASNYSIGVNLFFALNEYLAQLMQHFSEYEISMSETHHTEKKDAPSGTAISLAEGIMKHISSKTTWTDKISALENEIPIESFREANVPGTHLVSYESVIDQISIEHQAFSREGFASGAVLAAEWLQDKTGSFDMMHLLQDMIPQINKSL